MNSRHLTGHAVDIAPLDDDGEVSWAWPLYHQLAPVVKQAAKDLGVDLEWGGDWRSLKDGPHWQLSWHTYASDDMAPRANMEGARRQSQPNVFVDEFEFRDPRPMPEITPPVAPPAVEVEQCAPPKTLAQSTTIRAAMAVMAANGGTIFATWGELDDTTKMIVGGLGAIVLLGCFWIFSERLKKMVEMGI